MAVALGTQMYQAGEVEKAVASPDDANTARLQMGAHLSLWGRTDEAVAAFEAVIESGHPGFAPQARACLDHLQQPSG